MRTWFITGASRGLGCAIARAALAAGDAVAASARDPSEVANALADAGAGDRLLPLTLDVTEPDQADAAVRAAIGRFGRIDVLVNNAGYGQLGFFETLTRAQVERQFATNLFGVLNVTHAVLPHLRAQRAGHLVNVSSTGGVIGYGNAPAYTASKFAIEGFSEDMAIDLEPFGIRVTVVEPGSFGTDFLSAKSAEHGAVAIADYAERDAANRAAYAGRSGRQPGDPAKLARAVLQAVGSDAPPFRLALGSDAARMTRVMLARRAAELERWLPLSLSTDRDGAGTT